MPDLTEFAHRYGHLTESLFNATTERETIHADDDDLCPQKRPCDRCRPWYERQVRLFADMTAVVSELPPWLRWLGWPVALSRRSMINRNDR